MESRASGLQQVRPRFWAFAHALIALAAGMISFYMLVLTFCIVVGMAVFFWIEGLWLPFTLTVLGLLLIVLVAWRRHPHPSIAPPDDPLPGPR
jgi:hypothetical protein